MKMKNRLKKILAICLLFFIIAVSSMPVSAEEPNLQLYAKAAVLMDADSGRVLFERCGH